MTKRGTCTFGPDVIRKGLAVLLMLILIPVNASAGSEYRSLSEGCRGRDVTALKLRMYQLGYFTSDKVSDVYNKVTAERVRQLQKANGLEETGIATPELQQLVFSDACVWKAPTPKPSAVPKPTVPPGAAGTSGGSVQTPQSGKDQVPDLSGKPVYPALNDSGFLSDPQGGPYIIENQKDGYWCYISTDIHIEIYRYTTDKPKLMWYEAYITLSENRSLASYMTGGKTPGLRLTDPKKIAKENNCIFAISDDFFGYRIKYKYKPGLIIRNGEILYTDTKKAGSVQLPPLDVIALYPDGRMLTYGSDEKTAEELIADGVTDTWAFGPILLKNGEIPDRIYETWSHAKEPRMAIGMISPRNYCVIAVTGRRRASEGAAVVWLAERMQSIGVREALNLDGGGSASLIFMDKCINHANDTALRSIGGVIGLVDSAPDRAARQ